MDSFTHLHVHSCYSMMRGTSSPRELCRRAAEAGYGSLALTDTNGFYGVVDFIEAAKEHGIKPVIGAEIKADSGSAVILAKSVRGYELLSQIISIRHLRKDFSLLSDLPESKEDLAVLATDPELLKAVCPRMDSYVEVVPGPSDRRILKMAHALDISPVATNDVYMATRDDYPLHRLLRAIGLNGTLSDIPAEEIASEERWLKPAKEMEGLLPHAPEVLANAARLAAACHKDWGQYATIFPRCDNGREDHLELLRAKCREGISYRFGKTNEAIEKRLQEELSLIEMKGFIDYFLIVAEIVKRRPIHCGRGSGAASLVSFLTGITDVDPIRHNLLFGRFLNPNREDYPDIDVDFAWDERDGLIDEVREHYGTERFAMVSNHVSFGSRAAVREVAKVYGMPADEIRDLTRRLSSYTSPSEIGSRMENHPKFHGVELNPPWPEILELAFRLESIPRHLSTHCGGVILVPDSVSRYVPVEMSAKGVRLAQWQKDQIETAGMVKIDLLGNRSLAVVRDTLASIRENSGKHIDYALLNPVDDPATLELLSRGETMGIFYTESPAMRQLQKKAGCGDFDHLVIHSSIIRPAANRYIREYLKRLRGEPYEPVHPALKEILDETYGILVYQEDVIRVSMALAGFNWAEADGLRKTLSKKAPEKLSGFRDRFFQGCAERAVSSEAAQTVWEQILAFSGYSFCKPHSASYVMLSMKAAYLKAHYPAEFMAAVISNGGGYYTARAYISEARRMGLTVSGPDINESELPYRGKDRIIRTGLMQIKEIRHETITAVLNERKMSGPYRSLDDLLRRVELSPSDAQALVKSGALDSISATFNRPQALWFMEALIKLKKAPQAARGNQPGLFQLPRRNLEIPSLPDISVKKRRRQEMESLGFLLSVHPLEEYKEAGFRRPVTDASELNLHIGKRVRVLGWPVARKEVSTQKGEPMEFVSFEDTSAVYEAVFFPAAFRRFCPDMLMGRGYLLTGRVEEEFGAVSLNVDGIHRL